MTEKALSQITPTLAPKKSPKWTSKPENFKEADANPIISEMHGIRATSPGQLAEDLKISLFALQNINIRTGDTYAIEGWKNAEGVFESTIIHYRGNRVYDKETLLLEHDYRGNEWTPTNNLQIKLIRPTPESNFEWKGQFSVPGRNITEFQLELARITDKINTHCATREGLKELSAQCQVQGESGVYTVSVPKNAFQELIFPSFWNQINLKGINRLASLVEIPASKEWNSIKKNSRDVILTFLQESIDLTVSIQALEKKIQQSKADYLKTQMIPNKTTLNSKDKK